MGPGSLWASRLRRTRSLCRRVPALPRLVHSACFVVKPHITLWAAQTTVLTAPIRLFTGAS